MRPSDRELFEAALHHLGRAKVYSTEDLTKGMVLDAISMRLVAMIDTLGRLSDDVLLDCLGEDWILMRGMRNRIVHGYMSIDPDAVRITVKEELTNVESRILMWLEC